MNPLLTEAYTRAAVRAASSDAQRALRPVAARRAAQHRRAARARLDRHAAKAGATRRSRRYLQILELDPRNALAQSGLIGLLGRADPLAAESAAEAADRARALGLPAFHARQSLRRPVAVGAGAAGLLPGPPPRAGQSRLRLQPRRRPRAPEPAEARPRLLPPRRAARRRHRARPTSTSRRPRNASASSPRR